MNRASRWVNGLAFVAAVWLAACAPDVARRDSELRVLFVGNSLTYVGNLPAVVEAVAASGGHRLTAEMLVAPGATLAERVADGSVAALLAHTHFDVVVLQERGGDVLCGAGPGTSCASQAAHVALGELVHSHGARLIVLGTYQRVPEVSAALEQTECEFALLVDATCIPVSERLRRAAEKAPDLNWLHADGGHPGHDLVLLEALLLDAALFHEVAVPHALVIRQPMFGPDAHFDGARLASAQHVAAPMQTYAYEQPRAARVAAIVRVER
jgi:hypothetical protein